VEIRKKEIMLEKKEKELKKERLYKHPQLLEHLYLKLYMSQTQIASLLHINSGIVAKWLKEFGIKKPKRDVTKKGYRGKEHIFIAEKKLGRPLKKGETVHHIDGDKTNNDPNNIYIFKTGSDHAQAHKSLRKLSYELVKKGIIKFDYIKGEYNIKKTKN